MTQTPEDAMRSSEKEYLVIVAMMFVTAVLAIGAVMADGIHFLLFVGILIVDLWFIHEEQPVPEVDVDGTPLWSFVLVAFLAAGYSQSIRFFDLSGGHDRLVVAIFIIIFALGWAMAIKEYLERSRGEVNTPFEDWFLAVIVAMVLPAVVVALITSF